jgi:hypothetical protein
MRKYLKIYCQKITIVYNIYYKIEYVTGVLRIKACRAIS